MVRPKLISSERQRLEAQIGDTSIIPRPPEILTGAWDAANQADVIITRIRCSLREASAVFLSTTDDTAALKLNKSSLGFQLQRSANQGTLATAAKALAHEAGIATDNVTIHKAHYHSSDISFSPSIFLVLPNEESVKKLLDHVHKPHLKGAEFV